MLLKPSVAANELAQFAITEPSDVGFVKQSLTLLKPSAAAPQKITSPFLNVDFLSIKSLTKVRLFASKLSNIIV